MRQTSKGVCPHPAGRIACAAPYNEQCITRTSNPAMKMRCFAVKDSARRRCKIANQSEARAASLTGPRGFRIDA